MLADGVARRLSSVCWQTMSHARALASDALYRYCNAILKNCNAIFDFQITLFSISNNAIFDFKKRDFPFLMTQFLLCHKYRLF